MLTIDCVNSIHETFRDSYRIYIVDNCSSTEMPGEFQSFIDNDKDVVFIPSDKNKGYAGGNNIGIVAAKNDCCDYILITNNDVIFHEDSIDNLRRYLADHPDVGIVGPKVFLPDGRLQEINMVCKMDYKGKYLYLLRKTPLKKLSENYVARFHGDNVSKDVPFVVFAVSGCCFMMSAHAADIICPLDEGTFLYEEENIIGCRMENASLKTVYCTDSTIMHIGGGSTEGMSKFSYACFVNSELYYMKKYLGKGFWSVLPIYLFREVIYLKTYGLSGLTDFLKTTRRHLFQGEI